MLSEDWQGPFLCRLYQYHHIYTLNSFLQQSVIIHVRQGQLRLADVLSWEHRLLRKQHTTCMRELFVGLQPHSVFCAFSQCQPYTSKYFHLWIFLHFSAHIYSSAHRSQNAKELDRGRLSGHSSRGDSGATRAVRRASRALKSFLSAEVDNMISQVFFLRRYCVLGILFFLMLIIFAHTHHSVPKRKCMYTHIFVFFFLTRS